ncbi:major facilitator superfamily domain-containing protein [Ephemerocybe angulata]|uniref:Major facilitator superfamily domain-containing protein n=1 Tax=Ephemerocybe angulata TaxID=980116 RepID=A0A8H6HGG3_9AGAR|nr:major facilitator superfamily domain-containing protein [Tulosesus angulatus]
MDEKKLGTMDSATQSFQSEKPLGPLRSADSMEAGAKFTSGETKRLLRKMDWNIVPFLALLYLLSFLDRTNIGNARLDTLEKDLKMTGPLDYNIALAVFFPWYVAAEIPSNIMMKRTSPSLWLAIIMFAWGVCMTLMGLVKNYHSLLVVRMALGLAEGGLFPGVTWYITLWYRRHECGFRMALFFSAATLAGAFGGLLARGITEMRGIGGRPGWAWIFILEGLLTILVAIVAKFVIHDSPETARFLTEEEKVEVKARMKQDRNALADEFHSKFVKAALKDWKIYVHMLITIGIYTPLYSISLFLPTIVNGMGYSKTQSQLMSVPPYVAGCIATITGGLLADRYKQRGLFMIGFCATAVVGFVMLISTHKPAVQYVGTFFAVCGIYPNVPMGVAWNGNNIGGATKRAVGIAMHVGFGNLGGVIAGFVYRKADAPRYFQGHGLLIATTTMSLCLSTFMHFYLKRENARRDALMRDKGLTLETYTDDMRTTEREKGDDATFFRFTI